MKYFCLVKDRIGTCYHEFYRGKWDNKTFWKQDSLLLHDDIFVKLELFKAFNNCTPSYDPYGSTEINQSQWENIMNFASQLSNEAKSAINEIKPWVNNVFKNENVFTILGI